MLFCLMSLLCKQNWFSFMSDQLPVQTSICVFPATPTPTEQKVHKAKTEYLDDYILLVFVR